MEALLGFHVGFWDYITFLAVLVILVALRAAVIIILGLPGRIAIAHNHPQADAVSAMGWLGFLGAVPWVYALIWAFKPTNVIDIRYLPEEERRATDALIAGMAGKKPSPPSSPGEASDANATP
jgi:Protein of unknown function (DUF3302)